MLAIPSKYKGAGRCWLYQVSTRGRAGAGYTKYVQPGGGGQVLAVPSKYNQRGGEVLAIPSKYNGGGGRCWLYQVSTTRGGGQVLAIPSKYNGGGGGGRCWLYQVSTTGGGQVLAILIVRCKEVCRKLV